MARVLSLIGSTTVNLLDSAAAGITTEHARYSQPDLEVSVPGRIVEQWSFVLKGSSQNNVAAQFQALTKLAREASEYHESIWRTTPVYLKQQAKNESNERYALVYGISGLTSVDPFTTQIEASTAIAQFQMTVIRENPWRSGAPGAIGTALTLDPSDGTGAPTLVHVANFRDDEDVDSIYLDDGGVFGSNLASTAAFDLFPTTAVANDALYIGSAGPWKHIVFNIGTAGVYSGNIILEYWNGAWTGTPAGGDYTVYPTASAGIQSQGSLFKTTGQWAINVFPPSDWATTSVNSQTKYWVRLRVSSVSSWTTTPANATVEPYSQRSPYVAIPAASIKGDSPPLFNVRMSAPAGGTGNPTKATVSRVLIGAKSRNLSTFVSHLNAGGDDNPVNWAVTDSLDGTSTSGVASPGGKHLAVDFSNDSTMSSRVEFTGTDLMDDWVGEYLVLVRCQQIGTSAGDIKVKVRTYLGGNSAYDTHTDSREEKTRGNDEGPEVLDLGLLRIPFARTYAADDLGSTDIILQVHAERTAGTATLNIYDLILLPVDEGVVGVDDPVSDTTSGASALRGASVLDLDPGVIADRTLKYGYIGGDLIPVEAWARMGRPVPFENLGADTRLYFVILHYPTTWGAEPLVGTLGQHLAVEIYGHQRYSMLRGSD